VSKIGLKIKKTDLDAQNAMDVFHGIDTNAMNVVLHIPLNKNLSGYLHV